ncbi:hypothetical protein DFP72DRAFT_430469 [Ephemerocybe angulata]|uniref:Uncharacterized protein n=1 Tax=Ephemerocybe angulata TaxID=980116 RepID=A0A8H6LU25_9AGAR|nr:hypothetical protein DFP72DRAFT_430469 [Tulosesus angulatus]
MLSGAFTAMNTQLNDFARNVMQSMHEMQEEQRREWERERRELDEQTKILKAAINQAGAPPRRAPRKPKQRASRSELPDHIKEHPCLVFFHEYIRDYIDRVLLKWKKADDDEDEDEHEEQKPLGVVLVEMFPPLPQEDYDNYIDRGPGAFKMSKQNFRFDFSRKPSDPFNKDALYFAVKTFRAALDDGTYNKIFRNGQPLPDTFLHPPYLTYMVKNHVNYHFKMYREAVSRDPEEAREKRLSSNNRSGRKHKLFMERLATAQTFPPLNRHVDLLNAVGPAGMSDDESEDEFQGGVHVRTRYFRVRPIWRNHLFEAMLHTMDDYTRLRKRSKIGRKCRPTGPPGRQREPSDRTYSGEVPANLSYSLYDGQWIRSLPEWQLVEVNRSKEKYDLNVSSVALSRALGEDF